MDSAKIKNAKPMSLEERHTKSLEVSRELRLKFTHSMFIPREILKDKQTKRPNSQDTEKCSKKLVHSKNKRDRYSENATKCVTFGRQNSKIIFVSGPINQSTVNDKKPDTSNCRIQKVIANENSSERNNFLESGKKGSTSVLKNSKKAMSVSVPTTQSTVNAEELDTSNCRISNIIVNENSVDSAISVSGSDILIEDAFKTVSVLNSHEESTKSSTDQSKTKHTKKSKVQKSRNFNPIDVKKDHIRKTNETPTNLHGSTENSTNRLTENNSKETDVEKKAAQPQTENNCETNNRKGKKRVNPSFDPQQIQSVKKLKGDHHTDSLFQADFQNCVQNSISPTKDGSLIEQEITNDLRMLNNLAESFSNFVSQVHKDLYDQAEKMQDCVEYARKRDAEQLIVMQFNGTPALGLNQPNNTTEETPENFTIFIEADILPKKSITFPASDIFNHKTITNKDAFYDDRVNIAKGAADQRYPNADLQPTSASMNNDAITKYPVLPSSHRSDAKRKAEKTAGQQQSLRNVRQMPKKMSPRKTSHSNVQIQNQTPTTAAASFLNSHTNQILQNQMYDHNNLFAASNYYSYRPETNFIANSWLTTSAEQWSERNFNPLLDCFNRVPTIEGSNEHLQHYQYPPPITFLQNPYLHPPLFEPSGYHTLEPNYLPAYDHIQLRKY